MPCCRSFSGEAVVVIGICGVTASSKAALPGAEVDAGPWASRASLWYELAALFL